MGNQQSSSVSENGASQERVVDEQVIRPKEPGTSVQFAPSLIQQLSSSPSSDSESSSSSANHHDSAILSRLQAETARLRHEEASIMASISSALEKENLDKEKAGGVLSSEILGRDIQEIREKVQRIESKRKSVVEGEGEKKAIKESREEVVKCYLANPSRPLDCSREVEKFHQQVGKLEAEFVASLR